MFAKIVLGAVLVGILPCDSQHQTFLAVPFEDDGTSIPQPQSSQQLIRNNHLVTKRPQSSGNLQPSLTQPSEDFVINVQPQLNNQQDFNDNFGRSFGAQQTRLNVPDQQQFQNFPTTDSILLNQALLENQRLQQRNNRRRISSDRDLLNIVMKPAQQAPTPTNSFLSVEEPTFSLAGASQDNLPTDRPRSFISSPRRRISQQAQLQIDPFASQQIQPGIQQHIIQPTQPQFHSAIDPHAALRLRQQQINSPIPQQFPQEIPTPTQPASPQLHQTRHRPRIHRPSSRNNQLINEQSLVTVPQHRFASSNLALQTKERDYQEEEFRRQAESAQYSFASQIDDSISGNQHQREEVRDGLNVKGMYSYSDGYVKRTVFYEADDKGYRVVKEEEEPLGNGPQINPKGQASVSSYIAGNNVHYSITSDDIQEKKLGLQQPLI